MICEWCESDRQHRLRRYDDSHLLTSKFDVDSSIDGGPTQHRVRDEDLRPVEFERIANISLQPSDLDRHIQLSQRLHVQMLAATTARLRVLF